MGIGRSTHGKMLTQLARLVDEGKIRPLIDPKSFQFSQVSEAHRYLESGEAMGKVVLKQGLF